MSTLFTPENKNALINCNDCFMLGTLIKHADYYPSSDEQQPVSVMKGSDNIIFYIRPLSTEPEPVKQLLDSILPPEMYMGVDIHHFNNPSIISLAYKMCKDLEQKKEMLRQKLENKLIVFKPKINFKMNDRNSERVFKNIDVYHIEPDVEVTENTRFVAVPRVNTSNIDLEKKLASDVNIVLDDYPHVMPQPQYILCGDYLYYNFPKWLKNNTNPKAWVCEGGKEYIRKIRLDTDDKELKNKMIFGSDNIVFIEQNYLNYNIGDGSMGEPIGVEKVETVVPSMQVEESTDVTEYKFLKEFYEFTKKSALCYELDDLINFHICVKTNPITILAGMAGTGKTQLALAYAKMLDLSEDDHTLLFLPISPSYTEPGDLLGYLNNTNGLFISPETGLTDFLKHAQDYPDSIHVVIFDEMNLSQVEHWFAPFISLLEKNGSGKRKLQLYGEKSHCINRDRYPHQIEIGNNIIFIGTVNMDETTKDFSDRLLDRANVVVLKKKPFKDLMEEQFDGNDGLYGYEHNKCTSYTQYRAWIDLRKKLSDAYTNNEIKFLDDLHDLIQKYDHQKGVSFRIFKKIGEYLNNIPRDNNGELMLSKRKAFDIQIKQRIITKIKGTEKQFGKLIGTISDNSEVPTNSELFDFFNSSEAKNISDFTLTKQEICRKAKELGIYGYTN